MLHKGLVDTVFYNKMLPCNGCRPGELNLTLKIPQLLASNIVYLQSAEAMQGFLPRKILFQRQCVHSLVQLPHRHVS